MAKLYFYYSAMNAGKSTALLQSSHNYRERGMNTIVFTPVVDTRFGEGVVKSRIGIETKAVSVATDENLLAYVRREALQQQIHCVLIDEAQFLTRDQVFQLGEVCDRLDIPVLCYGLRTDFQGELFPGSQYLLAWADNLNEIKTVCHCGKKATMVVRMNEDGTPVADGEQVAIGGNELYVSTCRRHYKEALRL
ncbi:MAG: thymidine kinase [Gammaproteobacteria bacterium]